MFHSNWSEWPWRRFRHAHYINEVCDLNDDSEDTLQWNRVFADAPLHVRMNRTLAFYRRGHEFASTMWDQTSGPSIIVFRPRAALSLQTQHSPLYRLLSLPFRICIQSNYHDVVYHLISSSDANLLPVTILSKASFSRQFLLSQWPSNFFFFLSVPILFYLLPLYLFNFECPFYTLPPSP